MTFPEIGDNHPKVAPAPPIDTATATPAIFPCQPLRKPQLKVLENESILREHWGRCIFLWLIELNV